MSEQIRLRIDYILEHVRIIEQRFIRIKTADDFIETEIGEVLLDAITIRLQAIGENVGKIYQANPALLEKYSGLDWKRIIAFRNIVSHAYERLDYQIVFDICHVDLPVLKNTILKMMHEFK